VSHRALLALRGGLLALLAGVAIQENLGTPLAVARLLGFVPLLFALPVVLFALEPRTPLRRYLGFSWLLLFQLFVVGLSLGESSPTLLACLLLGAVVATSRSVAAGVLVGSMAAFAGVYLSSDGSSRGWLDARPMTLVPVYPLAGLLAGALTQASERASERVEELREELAEQAERINNVLACIASGVLVVDEEGRVSTLNNAAARILGVPQHSPLGRVLAEHPALAPLSAALDESPSDEPRQDLEFTRPDGDPIVIGYAVSPLENRAGRRLGRILVFQDVTLLRDYADRMLRQEQLAALGRMVSGIAHEFGNQLGGARGLLEMAALEEPAEAVRSLPVVTETLGRALETVDNLLRFARGTPLNRVQSVEVREVVEHALQLLRAEIDSRQVEVETRFDPAPSLYADPVQLEQVFLNLLINAMHAVEGVEDPKVRLSIMCAGDRVLVRVEDNGPGITKDVRDRIFEPFFTTKGSLGGSKVPGTGLGLSLALGVVQAHDGTLTTSLSDALGGACFEVNLPSTNGDGSVEP
jgi:PAS domain S-box-containing protein